MFNIYYSSDQYGEQLIGQASSIQDCTLFVLERLKEQNVYYFTGELISEGGRLYYQNTKFYIQKQ